MEFIFFLLVIFLFSLIIAVKLSKGVKDRKKMMKDNNVITFAELTHVEGLPIAEKTKCCLMLKKEELLIEGGGISFNINISQITASEVKTDVEIANIIHSSAAKGIIGGLVFGPIGLVVGSRAKNKVTRTKTYYLLINYISSSGEVAAIMFDSGTFSIPAFKIANSIKHLISNKQPVSVQL